MLLIGLGFGFLFSFHDLEHGVHPGTAPTWHDLAYALPLAMLAYTGLETLANLAAGGARAGEDDARAACSAGSARRCSSPP